MGMQDRDWYRDALRDKENRRQLEETRAKFSRYSAKNLGAKAKPSPTSLFISKMVVWCILVGLLYGLMTHFLKPKPARVLANGDLVIQRSQDGHFYTLGTVNGSEAKFMIDTGASMVSVSERFAQKASIFGGAPATFKTANGDQPGRIVEGMSVAIGPVSVSNVKVGVGLRMDDENDALLGQSFLSNFDITMGKDQMILRTR